MTRKDWEAERRQRIDKPGKLQVAVENDLHHASGYRVGEWMAPGQKICKQCGYQETVTHATPLQPCAHCGGEHFQRQPLSP